jgi:Acetoacetate decarboxylase (ADC)
MLTGFTPPYSPSGRSALIPAPPWHYAGHLLSLAFELDAAAAQTLLPDGFGTATGAGAVHFCEWQSTTDGSELLDPAYAQYREFLALIEVERDGARCFYCPFIYVDQDLSMARGWLQGWPKKMGSVWLTRSYELDHPAAAPARAGTRVGASLAVKDRRLAEAVVTLTGEPAAPIGLLAAPSYGLIPSPKLLGGADRGSPTLARATPQTKVQGPAHAATGTLRFLDSPRDELAILQPKSVTSASVSTFAFTITGATAG